MNENLTYVRSIYEYEVQWGDCDAADIVYYPNYYRWFDNASHHLFNEVGLSFSCLRIHYDAIGFPLVNAQAKFLKPSRIGDVLHIESVISRIARKTIIINHLIQCKGQDIVKGEETRILGRTDQSGELSAIIIPDAIRTQLGFTL